MWPLLYSTRYSHRATKCLSDVPAQAGATWNEGVVGSAPAEEKRHVTLLLKSVAGATLHHDKPQRLTTTTTIAQHRTAHHTTTTPLHHLHTRRPLSVHLTRIQVHHTHTHTQRPQTPSPGGAAWRSGLASKFLTFPEHHTIHVAFSRVHSSLCVADVAEAESHVRSPCLDTW